MAVLAAYRAYTQAVTSTTIMISVELQVQLPKLYFQRFTPQLIGALDSHNIRTIFWGALQQAPNPIVSNSSHSLIHNPKSFQDQPTVKRVIIQLPT